MPTSDFAVHSTDVTKWISFPAGDAYAFIRHGFIVKNPSPPSLQGITIFLQKITSSRKILISPQQMHQDECITITSRDKLKKIYKGDALLTNRSDVFLSVQVADCVPIFLIDEKKKIIGLIHAGWKGTLLGIAPRTIEEAQRKFGCKPEDLTMLFGPCIRSCCYQVSGDVAILFDGKCVKRSPKGRFTLDLICANRQQLINCGVKEERIFLTESCTGCNEELFHSYRREKDNAGRMIAFLGLERKHF